MKSSTRQLEIINLATAAHATPAHIVYTPEEHRVWETVCDALMPIWEARVAYEVLIASARLNLPTGSIPQLTDVSRALECVSGFEFRAVGGLAPREEFFGNLAHKRFLSTQYIRDAQTPFYTEQPDIIHEVIGHATLLADPQLAELHRLAGKALISVETESAKQFIANVWWFSGEFGLVRQSDGIRAVGAGLLSSVHELQNMLQAKLVPMDPTVMGHTSYDIDQLQTTLFVAESMAQFVQLIGDFFRKVDDQMIAEIMM